MSFVDARGLDSALVVNYEDKASDWIQFPKRMCLALALLFLWMEINKNSAL